MKSINQQTQKQLDLARENARATSELMVTPLLEMQRQMNQVWEGAFKNVINFPENLIKEPLKIMPKIHVSEDEKAYYLTSRVPGCREEHIDIEVHDDHLVISCKVHESNATKTEQATAHMAAVHNVQRTVVIPGNGDADKAEARLQGDTLIIKMPKKAAKNTGRSLKISQPKK